MIPQKAVLLRAVPLTPLRPPAPPPPPPVPELRPVASSLSTYTLSPTMMEGVNSEATSKSQLFTAQENMSFTVFSILVTLFLIVLGISLVVILATGSSRGQESTEASTDGSKATFSQHPDNDVTPQTSITAPRPTLPSTQPPPQPEPETEPEPTPEPPVPPPTAPPKGLGPETLLCTYGLKTTSRAVMAEDGLCDYAIYDSLYANHVNKLSGNKRLEPEVYAFLSAAKDYKRTTLGVGFAFQFLKEVEKDLQQTNPSPLEIFWERKVFHAGIIDTPADVFGPKMKDAILTLKMIDRHLDIQRGRGYRALNVLAGPAPERDWSVFLADRFREARFTPDLLVMFGHYRFGDNTLKKCAVMPPTRHPDVILPDEIFSEYRFDLSAGAFSLRELHARNVSSRRFLSVTMKGRWTEPDPGQQMGFFARCKHDPEEKSFGSYTEVCRHTRYAANLKYVPEHYAMLTFLDSQTRAFAYDNEQGLAGKLCRSKNFELDVNYGIAAFNVDYDDYSNVCASINKFGRHSRLKTLRRIVDYFRRLASSDFALTLCMAVVP